MLNYPFKKKSSRQTWVSDKLLTGFLFKTTIDTEGEPVSALNCESKQSSRSKNSECCVTFGGSQQRGPEHYRVLYQWETCTDTWGPLVCADCGSTLWYNVLSLLQTGKCPADWSKRQFAIFYEHKNVMIQYNTDLPRQKKNSRNPQVILCFLAFNVYHFRTTWWTSFHSASAMFPLCGATIFTFCAVHPFDSLQPGSRESQNQRL